MLAFFILAPKYPFPGQIIKGFIFCFFTLQHRIKLQLDSAQALIIRTYKADNLRSGMLLSIVTLALLQEMQPRQLIIFDNLLHSFIFFGLHRPFNVDKVQLLIKVFIQLRCIHLQCRSQQFSAQLTHITSRLIFAVLFGIFHCQRVSVQSPRHNTDSKLFTVTVDNLATRIFLHPAGSKLIRSLLRQLLRLDQLEPAQAPYDQHRQRHKYRCEHGITTNEVYMKAFLHLSLPPAYYPQVRTPCLR